MAMVYHLLNSSRRFDPYIEFLGEHAGLAIQKVEEFLLIDADVCITHDPLNCNPILGIGGGAYSQNLIHINLDAGREDFKSVVRSELLSVLAHEAHHCKRMASIPYDLSLIDSIVTEGLACQFELEVAGGSRPTFLPESVTKRTKEILAEMQPHLEKTDYCYETFFLGKDTSIFPKYAGFAVGFDLVGRFLKSEATTAENAAAVIASDLLPYAKSR